MARVVSRGAFILVAMLLATYVGCTFVMLVTLFLDPTEWVSLPDLLGTSVLVAGPGLARHTLPVLSVALILVVIAEYRGWNRLPGHLLTGFVFGVMTQIVAFGFINLALPVLFGLGGIIAAMLYWAMAGRHAGHDGAG